MAHVVRPKVRRTDRGDLMTIGVLAGAIIVLVVVLGVLLSGVLSDEPRSDAERDYELLLQGLKQHPDDPAVLMTLAEVEYELGKKGEAIAHAEKAVKVAGVTEGYRLRLAQLYILERRLEDAQEQIEAELKGKDTTSDPEAHFLLGQVLRELGKVDDALDHLARACELEPVNADYRIVYAQTLETAGKEQEAIDQYREALRFIPDDPRAREGLERLGVKADETTGSAMPTGAPVPGDAQ